MPKQHAALKQQGMSPEVVSQQVLMQHAGQESKPEAAASAGRADAAADDAALVYLLPHCCAPHTHTHTRTHTHARTHTHTHTERNGCIGPVYIAGIGAMYQSHGLNAPTVKSTMLQRSACGLKQAAHSAAVVVYAD